MRHSKRQYTKDTLIPVLVYSLLTGVLTGALIFLFKISSSAAIGLSDKIYGFVRVNKAYLPLLLVGAAALGGIAGIFLHFAPNARGGGIPTAIAALRGQVPIKKIITMPFTFLSSLATFLCGVPLGTEGPSVQMGTSVGWMVSITAGRKKKAWQRYTMTGGACAGFAAATGAPLSGIFFAFEEAHRRFTPMIFMSASLATLFSSLTMEALCSLSGVEARLFGFTLDAIMPIRFMWSALLVGLVCGMAAIFFTKSYRKVSLAVGRLTRRIPFAARLAVIFVAVALIGVTAHEMIGTGHHLIDTLIEGHGVWYMLIIYLLVRSVFLMIANTEGVTGGLFIPSLAIGAMIGALVGRALVAVGILPREYCVICVVIGMSSFLAASSRVPITALAFSIEALSGLSNLLPIAIGVSIAFAVIETAGVHSFNDAVIDTKIIERNRGREILETSVELIVQKGAFVIGREVRDILWPPNCLIVSVIKNPDSTDRSSLLGEDDMICVHYRTAYPEETAVLLEDLVGSQREHTGYGEPHPNDVSAML